VKTAEATFFVKAKYDLEYWQENNADRNKSREVIELLEQGEAYRQLVKELKEFYGNGIVENECGLGVKLFNLIEILEGKYFPKEAK